MCGAGKSFFLDLFFIFANFFFLRTGWACERCRAAKRKCAMTEEETLSSPLDVGAVKVLLCDADGNLFASEEPAFVASTVVTNRLLAAWSDAAATAPSKRSRIGGSVATTSARRAIKAVMRAMPSP